MTQSCFDGLFIDIIVETIHKKKKGLWSVETEHISGEGKTEKEAIMSLVKELRYLADNLEATIEKDQSR